MRSHVTNEVNSPAVNFDLFQYRKRYEITCDVASQNISMRLVSFQYRKRYEITCDHGAHAVARLVVECFNTASGMRSHVT